MTQRKLQLYRGPLSPAQAAEGMAAASANAQRLAEDARLLFIGGRYPTAASLAALSIEESGKLSILRSLVLARDAEGLKEEWRAYRSHTSKNVLWLLPQLVREGARKLDDFARLFSEDAEHPSLLDQTKQLGIYTDCLGNAHWSVPTEVIDQDLAGLLVNTAEILAGDRAITVLEMELWVEHVGPVWKGKPALMKQALTNWYADLQAHGLRPLGDNPMQGFMLTKTDTTNGVA